MYEWKRSCEKEQGVICGADKSQEWLLPWWWSRYKDHHTYPVTFCDFGMSPEVRKWCSERGEVVSVTLDPSSIIPKTALDPEFIAHAEKIYGKKVWDARLNWFKKPFALLQSSYKTGLWIDLDCEILGSLNPLFSPFDSSVELALIRESRLSHLPTHDPDLLYNGGVIVFKHGSPLIQKWAQSAVEMNQAFLGDDHLLSYLIHQHQVPIHELSPIYNWRYSDWLNLNAVVIHWLGEGKEHIRHYGGLKPHLEHSFNS